MPPARIRRLLTLLPLVAVAGCSGTPFGDQLSRSFSTPPVAPPAPRPSAPEAAPGKGDPAAALARGGGGAPPATPALPLRPRSQEPRR
ncbi:MAG: hypothetical protein ACKOCA_05890 [Vulcanococcus sp.]